MEAPDSCAGTVESSAARDVVLVQEPGPLGAGVQVSLDARRRIVTRSNTCPVVKRSTRDQGSLGGSATITLPPK